MFTWFNCIWNAIFHKCSRRDNDYSEEKRNNLPANPLPPLPNNKEKEKDKETLLWYPRRVIHNKIKSKKMKTRGYYNKAHPEGAIIHYTAGRSRNRYDGGGRNALTVLETGIRGVVHAIDKGSYAYFVIDRDGNVFQQCPLNRWGYHAGKSKCPKTERTSVSKYYIGIELQNAGLLKKVDSGRFTAWFSSISRGDKYFRGEEVKYFKKRANIKEGHYHQCSLSQKTALVDLLLWLDENGNGIFSLDKVFGHDEVAPSRKSDPGGSIDMTMVDFRKMCLEMKESEDKKRNS